MNKSETLNELLLQIMSAPLCSNETGNLALAMSKARAEFKILENNRGGNYGGYADIKAIFAATTEALKNHEVALGQYTNEPVKDMVILYTKITHSSGQWQESRKLLNVIPSTEFEKKKSADQLSGSSMSYQKRYALYNILGIVSINDKDDNDYSDYEPDKPEKRTQHNYPPAPKMEKVEIVTKEQYDMLQQTLRNSPKLAERMLKRHNIDSFELYPKSHFLADIKRAQELVEAGEK